jgi:hypothetical protein
MYQEYLKGRENLEACGLDDMIILKHILREEYRLVKFEKRELRRVFGPKRYEIIGYWEKLHNYVLQNTYSSPMIKSRRMRWAGQIAGMGAKRNACRALVRKS